METWNILTFHHIFNEETLRFKTWKPLELFGSSSLLLLKNEHHWKNKFSRGTLYEALGIINNKG